MCSDSLRAAFLLFILELMRARHYTVPLDVIQIVKGELPMIANTVDRVLTEERKQGLQQATQAAMRLGRLLTLKEAECLAVYLAAHPMTIEQIAQASPTEIGRAHV